MQRRTMLIGLAAIIGAGVWYAFRPERLFIDKSVNESFSAVAAAPEQQGIAMSRATEGTTAARAIASGRFHGVAHATRGTATVYELPSGKRVLRFTDFRTSNGPDVRVYLVAASDANDDATVTRAGYLEVAPIKGNTGNQNYDLPAGADLSRYRAVTIWCHRFNVNFATAPLAGAQE
ncbi:MAG TPA: DM13 domain-containing protein [Gemmatimonadaceae bacterium]